MVSTMQPQLPVLLANLLNLILLGPECSREDALCILRLLGQKG